MLISGWIKNSKVLFDLVSAIVESREGKIERILLEENGITTKIYPVQIRHLLKAEGKPKKVAVTQNKVFIMEGVD